MNTVSQTAVTPIVPRGERAIKPVSGQITEALTTLLSMALSRSLTSGRQSERVSAPSFIPRQHTGVVFRNGPGVCLGGAKGSERPRPRHFIYQPALNLCTYIRRAPSLTGLRGYRENIHTQKTPGPLWDSRTFLKKFYKKISKNPGNGTRVAPCFRQQAGARKVHAVGAQVLGVQGFTGGGNEVRFLARGQLFRKYFSKNRRGCYGSGLPAGFISRLIRFNSGARNQIKNSNKATAVT